MEIPMRFSTMTPEEVTAFLYSLTVERRTFKRSAAHILKSDIVALRSESGNILGIGGIDTWCLIPLAYWVVASPYQRQGHGAVICRELINRARNKYPFLVAIIHKTNYASLHMCKKFGFRPTLLNYNYFFLYLPIRQWSYALYFVFAVFFPPVWYGAYSLGKIYYRLTGHGSHSMPHIGL